MKIKIKKIECLKCGHLWIPRKTEIRMCPKCKTPYFDVDRRSNAKKD